MQKSVKRFLSGLYEKNQNQQKQILQVADDLLELNFERLSVVGYIAAPVNLLHVLIFWSSSTESPKEVIWRNGIIISHAILMVFMIGLILATCYLTPSRRTPKVMLIIKWASLAIILLAGVVIVALDQLVTPNITPFLVICSITAMVYLLRPIQAVLLYLIVFAGYAWAIGMTQVDQAILLSNRVNGITAIGIAITLSIILWRTAMVTKLQEHQLLTQNKELEEKKTLLEQYAFYDKLTGLYNRHMFYEMIEKEQAHMRREGTQAILLLLDIDHFKRVNDLYGHPAGDKVLTGIGYILTSRLRKCDLISRWGGEEFLCCLTNTKLSESYTIANNLREMIAKAEFENLSEKSTVTVSIGVSILSPAKGIDFERAYQNVDRALYSAKTGGRNRVEICPKLEKFLAG